MSEQDHPYKLMEASDAWPGVDRAEQDLVDNGDIEQTTDRAYGVGSPVHQIVSGRPDP